MSGHSYKGRSGATPVAAPVIAPVLSAAAGGVINWTYAAAEPFQWGIWEDAPPNPFGQIDTVPALTHTYTTPDTGHQYWVAGLDATFAIITTPISNPVNSLP